MAPETIDIEFSKFAGELAESLSFNKSIGQIYGLLYVSPESLSLDDISKRLSMSKGNASINLRVLESWGAVQSVWVSGSRRDHYKANTNIKELVLRRAHEGILRRLDMVEQRLKNIGERFEASGSGKEQELLKKRAAEIKSMVDKGRTALNMLPKILGMFT